MPARGTVTRNSAIRVPRPSRPSLPLIPKVRPPTGRRCRRVALGLEVAVREYLDHTVRVLDGKTWRDERHGIALVQHGTGRQGPVDDQRPDADLGTHRGAVNAIERSPTRDPANLGEDRDDDHEKQEPNF